MIERYTNPEMGKLWSLRHEFEEILAVEIAACEAMAELGEIPKEAAKNIREKADFDLDRVHEIEKVTNNQSYARADETLVYKLPSWWYNATREFRDFVRNHDQMNPGDPWRHSDDYEQYSGYGVARGNGVKPETLPTIFETLNVL